MKQQHIHELSITVDDELYAKMLIAAARERKKIREFVREAIDEKCKKQK
jgi:hypothetical protein